MTDNIQKDIHILDSQKLTQSMVSKTCLIILTNLILFLISGDRSDVVNMRRRVKYCKEYLLKKCLDITRILGQDAKENEFPNFNSNKKSLQDKRSKLNDSGEFLRLYRFIFFNYIFSDQ